MKYVIIGNSAAAVGCIEGIRGVDRDSPIVVISKEPYHTYSRPLISYWLQGKVSDDNMRYRGPDFYEKNGCLALLGKEAVGIDVRARRVVLADGDQIPYDRLLVAAGSSPLVPPIEGLAGAPNAFTFLDWDSARGIAQTLSPESRVVILGAGLVGLKAAEGVRGRCAAVTVVDLADRVLPSILDAAGADIVRRHIEANGVNVILQDAASRVSGGQVELRSGRVLAYDVLIIAVGVRPNVSLVKDAGGLVGRGVKVDARQRTSLEEVYAAGDCVESLDISCGQEKVLALLPNAYMQGEVAGVNMAGGDASFECAIPMNSIGFFGLHMVTAGTMEGDDFVEASQNGYRRLCMKDGLLRGYILIGDVDRAGIYTSLIRERVPLDRIDLDMLKTRPQLLMFNRHERRRKMGGAAR